MTTLALSSIPVSRRWFPWALGGATALLAVLGYWLLTRSAAADAAGARGLGRFVMVSPAEMDVKVKKDGELQAVNNIDIVNQVEGQSTIVQIVKEGSNVKKGETLVVLDSSEIRQKLEDQQLIVQKAESELKTARELQSIQEAQNAADVEAAEVELELAKLALREYGEGTYPEALANAKKLVEMEDIALRNKVEELETTKNLYRKGFETAVKMKADQLSVLTQENILRKAQTALTVLEEFTSKSEMATRKSAVSQADQLLSRVKVTGASTLQQKVLATAAAEAALTTAKRKLEYLTEQLGHTTIIAPADGLVVYSQNDRNSGNGIAEGTIVRERQQLLRLPDTSEMKVVVRANESQVSKLVVGQQAVVSIVGIPQPVAATLSKKSPIADSGSRFWNPDLKEYPIELTLDRTPPGVLPGMSAQAEIFVDRLHGVLSVPLAAIYAERKASYVFVRAADRVEPRPIKIGQANETHVRIAEGLNRGEEVLILQAGQGRELLEKSGVRPPPAPAEREPDETDELPPAEPATARKGDGQTPVRPTGAEAVGDAAGKPAPDQAPHDGGRRKRDRDREPATAATTP
jgi:RND family efflux transporter MFP subunit